MATVDLLRETPERAVTPMASEADLYAAIVSAWYQTHPQGEHIKRPIRPYVFGPEFAKAVWVQPNVIRRHLVAVCARIVSLEAWQLPELLVAKNAPGMGVVPKEILDPAVALWHPANTPAELGVHFWRLGAGMIELRDVGPFDRPPALEFGRFAEAERRLEEEAVLHWRKGMREGR
jgi:hypothetical protein